MKDIKNKLIPLPGVIIVEPETTERITKSGIIIAAGAENARFLIGNVVEASKFAYFYDKDGDKVLGKIPLPVKKGDKVMFEESFARDYIIEGKKYFFCFLKDLRCIIDKDTDVEVK